MKALLCNTGIFEINNWYNFADCKKFILKNMPKNSTIIVDVNLFKTLDKLGIAKDYDVIIFDQQNTIKNASFCKNLNELARAIDSKNTEIFIPNGSSIFESLTPYCTTLVVANFNKNLKNLSLSPKPSNGHNEYSRFIKLKNESSENLYVYYNINTLNTFAIRIHYSLETEDRQRQMAKELSKRILKSKDLPKNQAKIQQTLESEKKEDKKPAKKLTHTTSAGKTSNITKKQTPQDQKTKKMEDIMKRVTSKPSEIYSKANKENFKNIKIEEELARTR